MMRSIVREATILVNPLGKEFLLWHQSGKSHLPLQYLARGSKWEMETFLGEEGGGVAISLAPCLFLSLLGELAESSMHNPI